MAESDEATRYALEHTSTAIRSILFWLVEIRAKAHCFLSWERINAGPADCVCVFVRFGQIEVARAFVGFHIHIVRISPMWMWSHVHAHTRTHTYMHGHRAIGFCFFFFSYSYAVCDVCVCVDDIIRMRCAHMCLCGKCNPAIQRIWWNILYGHSPIPNCRQMDQV